MLSKSAADRPAACEVALRLETFGQRRTFRRRNRVKVADRHPSIAVLPFANMSPDREHEYFSDGLAEEIINGLAHIPGLNVTARTSAFSFKGKNVKVAEVARELGVEHILEGSVRKAGNRIRITAQLIKAADGFHLWSERYDRELNDIFAVQDEISASIARVLQVKLAVAPAALRIYTPKLPAYEAYLKGLHRYATVAPDSLAKAGEYFEQAITLDSEYALPRSALGARFATLGVYGMQPAHEVMPLARRASQEALSIDPSLPEAQANLGLVAGLYDYDWKEAGRLFRLATARDPVPSQARQWYSLHLVALGRAEEAIDEARRALREDPLNLSSRAVLVMCLHTAGRNEEAAAEAHRTLEFDENQYTVWSLLSFIETSRGKLAEARAFAEKACSLAPWTKLLRGLFAGLLMRAGETSRASDVLAILGDGRTYRDPLGFIFYHLILGQVEQAADWVEKAIEQRDTAIYFLRFPVGAPLRSSARWPALARMMNLPMGVS
jgi:serine/threonine-protein kinase